MSQIPTELVTLPYPQAVAVPQSIRSFVGSTRGSNEARSLNDGNLEEPQEEPRVSKRQIASVISSVTFVAGLNSMMNGIVVVALPTIARDLRLNEGLMLWPAAISSLTCGCTFLISGSMVDVLGSRFMYLLGCSLQCVFVLGCGLAKTAAQLLVCLGLAGIAISFCLPSAVSIITNTLPTGKPRNIAFGSMGGSQPAGFALGLVLGGVLSDSIGWRSGFYISASINAVIVVIATFGLPKDTRESIPTTWKRRWEMVSLEIDWVGALMASGALALASYVLASVAGNSASISKPANATLLAIALALIPCFIFWVGRQERNNKPALIPNSLWQNRGFTTICISVFMIWGACEAAEVILSFFFQDVQLLTPTQASIRYIPSPVAGVLLNIMNGLTIHRVQANWIVIVGIAATSISPLLLAICNPAWSFWICIFFANCLLPAGADILFTVSNLVITSVFPSKTQGLAGGVFNTVSQIGKSVGLALAQVIATTVTARSEYRDKSSPQALLQGYRASFWYCFAINFTTLLIAVWGLRKIGKVGHKTD